MSLKSKAWAVATAVATVEALKDQLGFCRWNHTLSSVHHHAKTNLKSLAHDATRMSSSRSTAAIASKLRETDESSKSEESLRTVMQLSCWLPN